MSQRFAFCMATLAALVLVVCLGAQGQQRPGPGQGMNWAMGTVKDFSSGSVSLSGARDIRDPRSQPADMTFVINADTQLLHQELIRAGAFVAVHYSAENGKLVAVSVAAYGPGYGYGGTGAPGSNPAANRNPYNSVPGGPGSPTPPRAPASSTADTGSSTRLGACSYSSGPCISTPGPQTLPAGVGHDFASVQREADALAKEHAGARIYRVHLNYAKDAVWQAEFSYVTEPDGKVKRSRWGDLRVSIDPARENPSRYQIVSEFNDQMDDPPPLAPANLASPWDTMRTMNIPASIRQSPGGMSIDLGQVGATQRVTRQEDPADALKVIGRSAGAGQWFWVMKFLYPSSPGTSTVFQIIYADAVAGRATSECANMAGTNPNNWAIIACPPAYESRKGPNILTNEHNMPRFPK